LRSSSQVWLLIGCTIFHAEIVGTSGLSRQSDLILKTCAQLSKPAALAFSLTLSTELYFGRNCFR